MLITTVPSTVFGPNYVMMTYSDDSNSKLFKARPSLIEELRHFRITDMADFYARHSILSALIISFVVFFILDAVQYTFFPGLDGEKIRITHFVRGFAATFGGMVLVWYVMRLKENELEQVRKELWRTLQRKKADLAEVIEARNKEREESARIKQSLHDLRQDFLWVLDHRLNTPLLANQRTIDFLLEGTFGEISDKQSEILQLMSENNEEVARLTRMLSALYGHQTGQIGLVLSSADIRELICRVIARLKSKANKRSIQLSTDIAENLTEIVCDSEQIALLLHHLLENAIKYAVTKVTVSASLKDENLAAIAISDDGQGMPAEDVPNLFNRFYKMSATGKYAATTGVGLCLCSEIARAHGGEITCETESGKGTTFTVTIAVKTATSNPE
ncbi:MAG TPA: HAMP domain-containing sensor histidine kinase [Candidatus Obscuribacterales bacterium]